MSGPTPKKPGLPGFFASSEALCTDIVHYVAIRARGKAQALTRHADDDGNPTTIRKIA
jgi:hypothetical protein